MCLDANGNGCSDYIWCTSSAHRLYNTVGDGANLVTWAPSPRFLGGYLFSKSSIVNVTSGNNNSASSLLSAIKPYLYLIQAQL